MESRLVVFSERLHRDLRFLEQPLRKRTVHLLRALHPNQQKVPIFSVRIKIHCLAGLKLILQLELLLQGACLEGHQVLKLKSLLLQIHSTIKETSLLDLQDCSAQTTLVQSLLSDKLPTHLLTSLPLPWVEVQPLNKLAPVCLEVANQAVLDLLLVREFIS